MSPPAEEMMSWVLEGLGLSGAEGLPILSLFDTVNDHLSAPSQHSLDEPTKNELWQSLLARADVVLIDETKRVELRILTYQDVLVSAFRDQRVTLRVTPVDEVSHQNIAQPSKPISSSIEHDVIPAPTLGYVGPKAKPRGRPRGRGRPRKVVEVETRVLEPRKRRPINKRIPKAYTATQEEADEYNDTLEYEAGISRAYINPPGSERSAENTLEPEGDGEENETQTKKKYPLQRPMIVVFKSLNLKDPHFLPNRMGTWRPAYHARMSELRSNQHHAVLLEELRSSRDPAVALEHSSNEAEPQLLNESEAYNAEASAAKRKVDEFLEGDSITENGPIAKRAGRRMDAGDTSIDPALKVTPATEPQSLPSSAHHACHTQEPSASLPESPHPDNERHHQTPNHPGGFNASQSSSSQTPYSAPIPRPPLRHEYGIYPYSSTKQTSPKLQRTDSNSSSAPRNVQPSPSPEPVDLRTRLGQTEFEAADLVWRKKKLDDLKAECKRLGLQTSGKKAVLVARVRDALFVLDESLNEDPAARSIATEPTNPPTAQQPSDQSRTNSASDEFTTGSTFSTGLPTGQQPGSLARPRPLRYPVDTVSKPYSSPYAKVEAPPEPARASAGKRNKFSKHNGLRGPTRNEESPDIDNASGSGPSSVPLSASAESTSLLLSVERSESPLLAHTKEVHHLPSVVQSVAPRPRSSSIQVMGGHGYVAPRAHASMSPRITSDSLQAQDILADGRTAEPSSSTVEVMEEESRVEKPRQSVSSTSTALPNLSHPGNEDESHLPSLETSTQQIQVSHKQRQDNECYQQPTLQETMVTTHMNSPYQGEAQSRHAYAVPETTHSGQILKKLNAEYPNSQSQAIHESPAPNQDLHSNGPLNQQFTSPVNGPPRGTFSSDTSRPLFHPEHTTAQLSPQLGKRKRGASMEQRVITQTTPQNLYKSTIIMEIEAMEELLERFAAAAKAVDFPDITARLFVSYEKSVGNLILSKDRTRLSFCALNESPGEDSKFEMQISNIKENPIVSMKKTRPMELRLKYDDEEKSEIICRFSFGQTEAAFDAANEMRAAIVRARIIARAAIVRKSAYELFQDAPIPNIEILQPFACETCEKRFKNVEGIKYHLAKSQTTCNPNYLSTMKPFGCETCEQRFKNQEGLKYHLEKSQTFCNPDYVPKTLSFNAERRPTETSPAKSKVQRPEISARAAKRIKKNGFGAAERASVMSGDQETDASDVVSNSDSSSDDSIFAWAEKVAFVNTRPIARSATPTPRKAKSATSTPSKVTLKNPKVAAVTEEDVLSKILDNHLNAAAADETDEMAAEAILHDVVEEAVSITALAQQFSSVRVMPYSGKEVELDVLTTQRSKDIIMDLVNGNYGMFPGDRALWMAFVGSWIQKHPLSGVLPTFELCSNALNHLALDSALFVINFPGRAADSMSPTRSIIVAPHVPLDGPPVKRLKELVQMAFPRSYVPSKFSSSVAVLERLQTFAHGPPTRQQPRRAKKLRRHSRTPDIPEYTSEYEDAAESEAFLEASQGFEFDDNNSDDDEYFEKFLGPGDTGKRTRGSDTNQNPRRTRLRTVSLEALTSPDIYASPDDDILIDSRSMSRSLTENDISGTGSTQTTRVREVLPSRSRSGRPKARPRGWKNAPFPPGEMERRRGQLPMKLMTSSPKILQNFETGAWDQSPLHVKPPPAKKIVNKLRLPEPITYFQSSSGAWDQRAFGHGVWPVFARPGRRTDGNPNSQQYFEKLNGGYRPVLMPKENAIRMFFPAPPSKVLLKTGKMPSPRKRQSKGHAADGEVSDFEEPSKRRSKRPSASIVPEEEHVENPAKRRRTRLAGTKASLSWEDTPDLDYPGGVLLSQSNASHPRMKTAPEDTQQDAFYPIEEVTRRALPEFAKSPNPGLYTLPANFWVTNPEAGEQVMPSSVPNLPSKVLSFTPPPGVKGIETVAGWEQSLPRQMFTRAKPGKVVCWVTHTVDDFELSFDTKSVQIRWSDSTAFRIEDLPYDDLDDSEHIEPVVKVKPTKDRVSQTPAKRPYRRAGPTGQKKSTKIELRRRRLTAWPSDFDGVVSSIDNVRKDFGVELAPQVALHTRNEKTMEAEEESLLIVAATVIGSLTGGVEKQIDWVLVGRFFPQYAPNYISKAWNKIMKSQKPLLETLASDFQDAFLLAYESGEVPGIDYENLVGYDWVKLVEWAEKKIYSKTRLTRHIPLPSSRKEFKKIYDYTEREDFVVRNREAFFHPTSAIYRRMEIMAAAAHTLPAQPLQTIKTASDIEIDELTLARSWVRALCFTPQGDYNLEVAQEKLQTLGNKLVNEAKESLVEDKIIRHQNNGRAAPGRSFEPNDVFFAALRHHVTEQQFVEAVAFKKFLDSEFEKGKACVRAETTANEGTLMCITNLQAHGRIELKTVNVPMQPLGFTEGGYEIRAIPKAKFHISLDIYPSSSYLFDEEIPQLQDMAAPPRGGDLGELPVWYGITDELIPEIWRKVLVGVVGVTAMRAGASVESLEGTFKPALEDWEIWRLMEWCERVGIMQRIHKNHEGWTLGEWWWAMVGSFHPKE